MVEKAKKNRQIATNMVPKLAPEHGAEGGLGQICLAYGIHNSAHIAA